MKTLQEHPEVITAWAYFLGGCIGIIFLLIAGQPVLTEIIDLIQYHFNELSRLVADPYNFV